MPIARIAPRRAQEVEKNSEVTLDRVSPGKYQATITTLEDQVHGTGKDGRPYLALKATFQLNTPKGEATFPATLFYDKNRVTGEYGPGRYLRPLFEVWANDPSVNDPKDMIGKRVTIYIDRSEKGYLNAVNFSRSEDKEKR